MSSAKKPANPSRKTSATFANYYPNQPFMSMWSPHMWPRMWSPTDQYYPYTVNQDQEDELDPPFADHSANCCLSESGRCSGEKSFEDFGHNTQYQCNDTSVQTVGDDREVEELTEKLMDSKMDVLDIWQRLAFRHIDENNQCLQVMIEYVDEELKRFADKQDIREQLLKLRDVIGDGLTQSEVTKKNMDTELEAQKCKIMKDPTNDYDLAALEYRLKPYPDLLFFYKTTLDQILAEVEQSKKKQEQPSGNNCCDTKVNGNLSADRNLKEMTDKWRNFAVNDGLDKQNIDLSKLKSKVGNTYGKDLYPIIEMDFNVTKPDTKLVSEPKQNPKPEPKTKQRNDPKPEIDCSYSHFAKESSVKQNVETVSKPEPMVSLTKPETKPKSSTSMNINSTSDVVNSDKKSFFRPINTRPPNSMPNFGAFSDVRSKPVNSSNGLESKSIINNSEQAVSSSKLSARSRLSSNNASTATLNSEKSRHHDKVVLQKLSGIYPNVSEEKLLDAIEKTRIMFKSFGGSGFSGMTINKVVESVCKYIHTIESGGTPKPDPTQLNLCTLCKNKVTNLLVKVSLSCKHVFHKQCLDSWALKNNHCPDCGPDITFKTSN